MTIVIIKMKIKKENKKNKIRISNLLTKPQKSDIVLIAEQATVAQMRPGRGISKMINL